MVERTSAKQGRSAKKLRKAARAPASVQRMSTDEVPKLAEDTDHKLKRLSSQKQARRLMNPGLYR